MRNRAADPVMGPAVMGCRVHAAQQGALRGAKAGAVEVGAAAPRQSISKVRLWSSSTVMRTFIVSSGSSDSIFSGHSTRQRSPE